MNRQISKNEGGFGLMEVLVAVVLLGIVCLAIASNVITGLRFHKHAEIDLLAKNLAVSKVEELSGIVLDDLDDSYDGTEANLLVTGHAIAFTRVTDVTIEADGARFIEITVSSDSPYLPTPVNYSTRFATWES